MIPIIWWVASYACFPFQNWSSLLVVLVMDEEPPKIVEFEVELETEAEPEAEPSYSV